VKRYIALVLFSVWLSPFSLATVSGCTQSKNQPSDPPATQKQPPDYNAGEIEEILLKMNNATKRLKSCQAKISYLFIQDPDLLDSKTLQNGMLYYQEDNDRSQLRIRFDDLKQENFDPENRREEFLFDGAWLTRIDFKLKQIDRYQKAPEDNPIGVFELISHIFPLVGFSNIDQLKKDFDITLPEKSNESTPSINLLLNVKKGSKYEKEYKKIDFRADSETYMPQQIVAYSSQGDIYNIKFTEFEINKKLKKAVFIIETPSDFRKNIEPLDEKPPEKGN
jgi:outer membrane lipoprotein-sorting protein